MKAKIRHFGLRNLLLESDLKNIERSFSIDLRNRVERDKDYVYYPQFEKSIRSEAKQMATYYESFYCLEKTVREVVKKNLSELKGNDWWKTSVKEEIQKNARKNMKKEIDSGITPRSNQPIDYITFGELGEIIKDNWESFNDIFNSRKAIGDLFAKLNVLRGPIAHCCKLASDEIKRLELSVRDWFRLME